MWYTTEDARRDAAKQSAQREKSECRMEMVEDADLNITWECSGCGKVHKDTAKFEKAKTCPACGATISEWVGLYDDEDGE